MNLHDHILASDDLPREKVEVPEWGGITVYVATLTSRDKDAFDTGVSHGTTASERMSNFRARLVVACLTDVEGVKVFTPDEAEKLGAKSAAAVSRLFDIASRLNLFSKQDVDEAVKN